MQKSSSSSSLPLADEMAVDWLYLPDGSTSVADVWLLPKLR